VADTKKPDPQKLLAKATAWHLAVRGILEGILHSAQAISQAVEDPDHPLAEFFDSSSFPDFLHCLGNAACAMTNLTPPAACPIELPDPLADCL
jgi:hypothetical protein